MSDIVVNAFIEDHLEEMVVVTGLPRSGTSIVGQLVGSFDSVEYAYEPPMLPYFDARLRYGELCAEDVTELTRSYLFHDFYANLLHGRRYNFRPGDFSYVLDMKSIPEVLEKWSRVDRIQDALCEADAHTFCLKFPAFYTLLEALYEPVPTVRVIDINRNLERIVASLMGKRWFVDENLGEDATGMWPFRESSGELMAPYFVRDDDVDRWDEMTPETRTVYICNRLAEDRASFRSRYEDRDTYYELSYEDLVAQPTDVAESLGRFLDLDAGFKTDQIVGKISSTEPDREIERVLDRCAPDVTERFRELSPGFQR